MAMLSYLSITSLDGYIEDAHGKFDWSIPSEEVHAFVNDLERPVGTQLYGRRLYEVMTAWEDLELADESPATRDFAQIWRAADKIVFSKTLTATASSKTRIEADFTPERVRELKRTLDADLSIGGAELAGQALAFGLVDELHQFLSPIIVGSGKRFLPSDLSLKLELVDERRFANGVVYLHHKIVR
ncbi:MAG: deaminase [Frankiales bacterium]|nr:deaminase [Frankiales bacterium]